jgi:hypothetical protein
MKELDMIVAERFPDFELESINDRLERAQQNKKNEFRLTI